MIVYHVREAPLVCQAKDFKGLICLHLVFCVDTCDFQKYCDFKDDYPENYKKLMNKFKKAADTLPLPIPLPRNGVIGKSCGYIC